MSDGLTEQERKVQQQVANNQVAWDNYVDSRIRLYLDSRREDDTLPDALHEALGQILAEERRQWRRERALIESEAKAVISDLRATISELAGEIRQKAMEAKPGAQGERGEKGPPGPPGKLPIAKTFEPGRVYYEGEIAIRDGSTYQALRDTGHSVTHSDWICLARAGRDGRDGATPEIRGTYDVHERYAKLDIVACGGAAFIAKYDNPGICPGEGWQLTSQQGRRGKPGQTGEPGPRGEKGDTGPPEMMPKFLGSRIDENYNLLRILTDGTKEILALRPAFEQFLRETSTE
jgi:hypothetical protein